MTATDTRTSADVEQRLQRAGALLSGHFQLTSGKHSDRYVQCARLLCQPQDAEAVCRALAQRFDGTHIDLVVGPALGGVIVAHEVARALGTPAYFTERKEAEMQLRRGFAIERGARVLVVEDVVTTGGSVQEVVRLVRAAGAEVVGVGSIIQRAASSPFDVRYESLLRVQAVAWDVPDCPLCKQGLPAVKPGSRPGR